MKPSTNNYLIPGIILVVIIVALVLIFTVGKKGSEKQGMENANTVATTETTETPAVGSQVATNLGPQSANPIPCTNGDTAPSVQVLSPNNGTFSAGQLMTVKWNSCKAPASKSAKPAMITLAWTQGPAGETLQFNTKNDGQETFTIPLVFNSGAVLPATGTYSLRVQLDSGSSTTMINDQSDELLTINNTATTPTDVFKTAFVSGSGQSQTIAGSDNDRATFHIKFSVTAGTSDVYFPVVGAGNLVYQVQRETSPMTKGMSVLWNSVSGVTQTATGNYKVAAGKTGVFDVAVTINLKDVALAGDYRAMLTQFKWSTTDSAVPTYSYSFPAGYQTQYLKLN